MTKVIEVQSLGNQDTKANSDKMGELESPQFLMLGNNLDKSEYGTKITIGHQIFQIW